MPALSFDDLTPQNTPVSSSSIPQSKALSFDDLVPQQEPGFMNRAGSDILNRANEGADAIVAYKNGEQGLGQTGLQLVGKMGAGTIGDIIGEAAKSVIPDSVKNSFSSGAQKIADTIDNNIPQVGDAALAGRNDYNQFAKNNPNAARSIESVGDIANAGLALNGLASPLNAAKDTLSTMGEGSGVSSNTALAGIPKLFEGKEPQLQASNVKSMATDAYNYSDQNGGILKPQTVNEMVDKAKTFAPQSQDLSTFTGGKVTPSGEIAQMFENIRDKPLTLQGAQDIDKYLGNRAENEVNPATGAYTAEGQNIKDMQMTLRNTMRNAGANDIIGGKEGFDAYQKAVPLWAAGSKMGDIERILNNAELSDNPDTAIKAGFRSLAKNPTRLRGFDDDEVAAIKQAANSGIVGGALKIIGSKLMSGIVGTVAGGAGGGPLGAIAGFGAGEAAGVPLRAAANAIQRGRAANVSDLIANRPVVQDAVKGYINSQPPANIAPAPNPPAPPNGNNFQQWKGQNANTPINTLGAIGASGQATQALQPKTIQTSSKPEPMSYTTKEQKPFNTTINDQLMGAFAKAESNGNPNAKNPNSTASGLMQFTNRTWADMVNKYGSQTGIKIGDKSNPQAQQVMARLYAQDNIKELQKLTGRTPTQGELYAAHVLGATGASKLLNADPNQEAVMLFPRQVFDANRQIFFTGKRPNTVGEVQQILAKKVSS